MKFRIKSFLTYILSSQNQNDDLKKALEKANELIRKKDLEITNLKGSAEKAHDK